jgi:hypothetical protein
MICPFGNNRFSRTPCAAILRYVYDRYDALCLLAVDRFCFFPISGADDVEYLSLGLSNLSSHRISSHGSHRIVIAAGLDG